MRTYNPNGKGHLMLARLEEGPTTRGDLQRVAAGHKPARKQRMHRVVDALAKDGFARKDITGMWALTTEGAHVLVLLRNGRPVSTEGVDA